MTSAASRIREDDIDLLIDCSGHTRGAQPGILARKPARVIATHIATPGPVGLRAIDYKLTETLAESDDAQQFVLERLLPVPGGVFPWRRYPAPGALDRSSLGLAPGAFVCGAFVSLMKLSPRCLNLWRRVLEQLPSAVLAFSPAQASWQPAYLRWLQAHGIGRDRVVFVPCPSDEAGQLARYRVLDVALDPLPCGNVNGTMEALAMGVPVVTLVGPRHGERLGNALLSRFGVTGTIARDEDEYVRLVDRLARDPHWAAQLRGLIAQRLVDSPVWNADAHVRGLEAAYDQMLAERGVSRRKPMNPALRQALITADGLLRQGDARSARIALETFAAQNEADKESAEFQLLLAQACFQDGDPGSARVQVERAIAQRPQWAEAHQLLGLVLADLELFEDAARSLEYALALRPNNARACANLGAVYRRRGMLAEAATMYRRATALNPSYVQAWRGLAESLQAADRDDEALQAWRRWSELTPDKAEALSGLGWAFARARRWDEAEVELAQAAAQEHAEVRADTLLAFVRRERGDIEGALAAYRRGCQRAPAALTPRFGAALALPQIYSDADDLREWRARYTRGMADLRSDLPRLLEAPGGLVGSRLVEFLSRVSG